jgi:hypothetical protein
VENERFFAPPARRFLPRSNRECASYRIGGTVGVDYDPATVTVLSAGAPVSMWDVAAASAMYELCRLRGLGTEISLYE